MAKRSRERTPLTAGGQVVVPAVTEQTKIPISQIQLDGGTQMRVALHDPTVAEYKEIMEVAEGWGPFPPLDVTFDSLRYWLTNGFHRVAAARALYGDEYEVPVEIKEGDFDAAVLRAAKANADNGLRRTNEDKRHTVTVILGRYQAQNLTDGVLAEMCAVTARFVGIVRKELVVQGKMTQATSRKTADGRTINVSKMGRPARAKVVPESVQMPAAPPKVIPDAALSVQPAAPTNMVLLDAQEHVAATESSPEPEVAVVRKGRMIHFTMSEVQATIIFELLSSQTASDALGAKETEALKKIIRKAL